MSVQYQKVNQSTALTTRLVPVLRRAVHCRPSDQPVRRPPCSNLRRSHPDGVRKRNRGGARCTAWTFQRCVRSSGAGQQFSCGLDWTGLDWNRIDPPLPAEKEPQVIEPRTAAIDHSCVSCPGPCMLPLVWR
jgi:hypothetical protein